LSTKCCSVSRCCDLIAFSCNTLTPFVFFRGFPPASIDRGSFRWSKADRSPFFFNPDGDRFLFFFPFLRFPHPDWKTLVFPYLGRGERVALRRMVVGLFFSPLFHPAGLAAFPFCNDRLFPTRTAVPFSLESAVFFPLFIAALRYRTALGLSPVYRFFPDLRTPSARQLFFDDGSGGRFSSLLISLCAAIVGRPFVAGATFSPFPLRPLIFALPSRGGGQAFFFPLDDMLSFRGAPLLLNTFLGPKESFRAVRSPP